MNIGIDIMGGDFAPNANMAGALLALSELNPSHDNLFLFGDERDISDYLNKNTPASSNYTIIHAPEVIQMGEQPTKALTTKPRSSISLGFKMLKEASIDVFSGTGNTGAMVVGAISTLKPIKGVLRPCITSPLPKLNGEYGILLDVGAVPDCKPEYLYQFGIIGSLYAEHIQNKKTPRVALLNIGAEKEKGSLLYQNTYKLIEEKAEFNFIGNIEANQLLLDVADVVICDGYVGNIVLKQAEAFYRAAESFNISNEFFDKFNYEIYGGTPVLGINEPVLIGHGISNAEAVKSMILFSKKVKEVELTSKIKDAFEKQMLQKNILST